MFVTQGRVNVFLEIFKKFVGVSNFTLATFLHFISPYISSVGAPKAEAELENLRNYLLVSEIKGLGFYVLTWI